MDGWRPREVVIAMGITERRHDEKAALRQKILDAAEAIIEAEGVLGFSMRKLAKRINYSATTIYLFFDGKDDLLRELSNLGATRFASQVQNSAAWNSGSPRDRLATLMRKFFELCLEKPKAYLGAFFGEMPAAPPSLLWFGEGEASNPSVGMFLRAIEDGNANGSLAVRDPRAAVQACWAASHGLLLALLAAPKADEARSRELIETMISIFVAGMASEEKR